jgi:uncharacterized membrane protein YeaQ/YmgE (transglycosylase-associated protein family)
VVVILVVLAIVALLLVGGLVIGLTLKLLWWALIGLAIGALARAILPGRQDVGLLGTALYGIGGSLLGGIVGDAIGLGGVLQFVLAVAIAAALIALIAARPSRAV